MSEPEQHPESMQDLVVLLDPAGGAVRREMHFADFERLVRGEWAMPQLADTIIHAAYVQVGAGLKVSALACFTFALDEDGRMPPGFNIPLPYLAAHAGVRNDLGIGPVRVASRSQCPVPWFALKLWEPVPGAEGSGRLIQRAVMLNRIGLRSLPPQAALPRAQPAHAPAPDPAAKPSRRSASRDASRATGATDVENAQSPRDVASSVVRAQLLDERVALQREYLDQIREFRSEIQELKAALRFEQERNRRLQALVRGEL